MTDTDPTTETEQHATDKHRVLEHSPVSRRNFMRFSAASAGAFTLSGTALADHTSPKASELYEFIRDHVPEDYEIPTLILLTDETGFDALDRLNIETEEEEPVEFTRTTDPESAAYAQLTPGQVEAVLELSEVDQVEFSPGSNPFWKLGNYADGVFPAVSDSVDYIGFEQMIDGFDELASEHSDHLNFFARGHSAGHQNLLEGELEQQDMWFAEITNNVNDEESFESKEKPIFSLSIHGDEHQGREAGCRMAERILTGSAPELDALLDEVVIVFVFTNPDGWVVRNPQYIGPNDEQPGFQRENGAERDLNRSYPTEGWIAPDHYSGEPWGANLEDDQPGEIDDDVPEPVVEHVPDALTVTEQLRNYENIDTLVDMHGQGLPAVLIYTLTPNSNQFNHRQLHDLDEMTREIGESIREELGSIDQQRNAISEGFEIGSAEDEDPELPEALFRDASSVDTLGYTTTGGLRSFVAGRDEFSGLDTKSITIELAFSAVPFDQDILQLQVDAYTAAIRAVTEHATSNVDAAIDTDGRSTAYVTADALTRSSDDLVFTDIGGFTDSNLETRRNSGVRTRVTASPGPDEPGTVRFIVAEATERLVIDIEQSAAITATLLDPADEAVQTYDAVGEGASEDEWTVTDPAAGEWTIHVENNSDEEVAVTVTADEYLAQEDDDDVLTPDPVDVLGFEQHEYEVTPFQYFDDNSQFLAANSNDNAKSSKATHNSLLEPVSVSEVSEGALLDDGEVAYDNVVIIHDDPAGNSDCLDELDEFVDAGGNLVLTDTGVQLLGQLDTDLAGDITEEDVESVERQFALLGDEAYTIREHEMGKNLDHRLLDNVRPVQQELWNVAGMGYASPNFEAPMTLVDMDAFEGAGGDVAGITDDQVSVGALERDDGETGIQVIGSVLPPAHQRNLHPFGMLDYGIEFLGHTILLNALGYEQQRFVDGNLNDEWNSPDRINEP